MRHPYPSYAAFLVSVLVLGMLSTFSRKLIRPKNRPVTHPQKAKVHLHPTALRPSPELGAACNRHTLVLIYLKYCSKEAPGLAKQADTRW